MSIRAFLVGVAILLVCGSAWSQADRLGEVAGSIKLDLAQFRELAAFAQFGSDLDAKTQAQLEKGKRIVEIFKQPQYSPSPVEIQAIVLWGVQNNQMDDVPVDKVKDFQNKLSEFFSTRKADIVSKLRTEKTVTDEIADSLKAAFTEFKQTYR